MNLPGFERSRRSREVITPLLIAAGLIGLPMAIGLSQCSRDEDDSADDTTGQPPTVSTTQTYPNNYFVPGAGYYHSPYHAWFPFPFNHYVGGRGWYRGGEWRSAATPDGSEDASISRMNSTFPRSSPSSAADLRAGTSVPSAEAVSHANAAAASHFRGSVTRGGFGHSARPGVS